MESLIAYDHVTFILLWILSLHLFVIFGHDIYLLQIQIYVLKPITLQASFTARSRKFSLHLIKYSPYKKAFKKVPYPSELCVLYRLFVRSTLFKKIITSEFHVRSGTDKTNSPYKF
jgi:hypothetical protein